MRLGSPSSAEVLFSASSKILDAEKARVEESSGATGHITPPTALFDWHVCTSTNTRDGSLSSVYTIQPVVQPVGRTRIATEVYTFSSRNRLSAKSVVITNNIASKIFLTRISQTATFIGATLCSRGINFGSVSVCLSVTSQSYIKTAERRPIKLLFSTEATLGVGGYMVLEGSWNILKNKGTSLWNIVTKSGLRKCRSCTSHVLSA